MLIKDRFELLKGYQNNHVTIGFGSYGQVKLARDLETNNIVAVKVINKIAKNEVMMHYGLSHPKIINMIDVHIDTQKEITYMILQYADGGTLYEKIKTGTIPKNEIKKYYRDICEGLLYLHEQNIMHRDIKPENILINKNCEAKLCDFGFAALLGQRSTLCGTYEYMSPQMIQNRPYDYKIDIWAMGILLFQLISGSAPFRGDRPQQVLNQMKTKIFFCQRFQQIDINLVKMILRVTPNKRPTIEEILKHPFFDYKQEMTSRSTTVEEEGKTKSSLQFLNQSCNPRKMTEVQQIIEKEKNKEVNKEQKKQTYPPFYIPKTTSKTGTGFGTVHVQQKIQQNVQKVDKQKGKSPTNTRHSPSGHNRNSPLHSGQTQPGNINKNYQNITKLLQGLIQPPKINQYNMPSNVKKIGQTSVQIPKQQSSGNVGNKVNMTHQGNMVSRDRNNNGFGRFS